MILGAYAKWFVHDNNGLPAVGWKLATYQAGSSTPLATYQDSGGSASNANPIVFDARGEATIFFQPAPYKLVLTDNLNNVIWTVDNYIPQFQTTINIGVDSASNVNMSVPWVNSGNVAGQFQPYTSSSLYFNPSTGTLTANIFNGNMGGGTANSIPYQTAPSVTAYLAQGTGVLQELAGAPTWTQSPTLLSPTMTIQPTGDNSTKGAATGYVDGQIITKKFDGDQEIISQGTAKLREGTSNAGSGNLFTLLGETCSKYWTQNFPISSAGAFGLADATGICSIVAITKSGNWAMYYTASQTGGTQITPAMFSLKFKVDSGGVVTGASFSGNATTATDLASPNAITGAWTGWTPTASASTGTITGGSFQVARYMLVGKTLFLSLNAVSWTLSGTPTWIGFSLPTGIAKTTTQGNALIQNSGNVVTGSFQINAASSVLEFFLIGSGNFTTGASAGAYLNLVLELA